MAALPLKKKIAFTAVAVILMILAVELLSFLLYPVVTREKFSFSRMSSERTKLLEDILDPDVVQRLEGLEILHPYFGYVYNPLRNSPHFVEFHHYPINEYGWKGDTNPVLKRSEGKVIIGIMGGSVAYWFSVFGQDTLLKNLGAHPAFRGKDIEIVRLGLGGYKQPQQILILSYLLALGGEFDILINIDGFNEIVLPPTENLPKKVNPFYPRNWFMRVSELLEDDMKLVTKDIAATRGKWRKAAAFFNRFPMKSSATLNLVWFYVNRKHSKTIYDRQVVLSQYQAENSPPVVTGPKFTYGDLDELFNRLADVWVNGSIQLNNLCRTNGIRYYHILQPNQYTDSKPLSAWEKQNAYDDNHPYRLWAREGYPYLRERGRTLLQPRLAYVDLTEIFSGIDETLYIDTCCHYNTTGNSLIADAISEAIFHSMKNDQ